MLSPVANVPSQTTFFPNVKSAIIPNESPSTPGSYVSLLDTSQSPGLNSCIINEIHIFF